MNRLPLSFLLALIFFSTVVSDILAGPDLVQVKTVKSRKGSIDFYADNSCVIPCFLTVKLEKLVNMKSKPENPFTKLLPANRMEIFLFSLVPEPGKKYSYLYSYHYVLGDPKSVHHDDSFPYLLPYENGTTHLVSQGYNGQYSHRGLFALDFIMDPGTKVTAARGGIVVLIKEDSDRGGPDISFENDANYILIYHDDGSFGYYAHLKKDGAVVNIGDRVQAGELIGYSGNTGFSSQPHLHLDVSIPLVNGKRQTVPVKFLSQDGALIELKEGQYYRSYRPD